MATPGSDYHSYKEEKKPTKAKTETLTPAKPNHYGATEVLEETSEESIFDSLGKTLRGFFTSKPEPIPNKPELSENLLQQPTPKEPSSTAPKARIF